MIEALETPIEVQTKFGTDTLTHRAWAMNHVPWDKAVYSTVLLGVLDSNSKFVPYRNDFMPGQEPLPVAVNESVIITGEDYDALMASNAQGKKAGVFRLDDVKAKHKEVKARVPVVTHPY